MVSLCYLGHFAGLIDSETMHIYVHISINLYTYGIDKYKLN